MAVTLTIAATDQTNYLGARSLKIRKTADGAQGTLDATLIAPVTLPAVEDHITFVDGATTVYEGTVRVVKRRAVKGTVFVDIACQDDAAAAGVPGTSAFNLSDAPNGTTTFGYQNLQVQTESVDDGTAKTTYTLDMWEPGLIAGDNIFLTAADYSLSAVEVTIQQIEVTYVKETAPVYSLTLGDALVRLENVVRDIPEGSITRTMISDGAISTPKLDALAVTADKLAAELILASLIKTAESGYRVELDPDGIRLYDSSDGLLVKMPTDGSAVYVKGEVEAASLVSTTAAEFRTAASLAGNSVMTLQNGVAAPTTVPTLTAALDSLALTSTPANLGYGIAYDSAAGTFWLGADPSASDYVAHEYSASTGALVRSITKTGSITTYTATVGSTSHISDSADAVTGSTDSHIATPLTIPSGLSNVRATYVSVYCTGYGGTASIRNGIWDTSGNLLRESATYTVPSESFSNGNSNHYNKALSSERTLTAGSTYWVGFRRTDTADGVQWDKDDGSGKTEKSADGSTGDGTGWGTRDSAGKPNVYLTYKYDVDTTLEGVMGTIVGVATDGTYIYALDDNGVVFSYLRSDLSYVGKTSLAAYIGDTAKAGLFYDATQTRLIVVTYSGTHAQFVRCTLASGVVTYSDAWTATGDTVASTDTFRGGVRVNDALTSSHPTWWVSINGVVQAYDINSGTGAAYTTNRSFGTSASVAGGVTHDGTIFRGYAAASPTKVWKFTDWDWTSASSVYWVGYSWYDSNATGGTHETDCGPRASITMNRRSRLQVTTPAVPTGGTDDPDNVRIYMLPGASDFSAGSGWLQATHTGTSTYLSTYTSSGTNDGAGTAFPVGTAAELKSVATGWSLKGDGSVSIASTIPIGGKPPTVQVKTSGTSAAYTVPTGCVGVLVEVVGGGGGGGGVTASGTAGHSSMGEGGAGGGYARKFIPASSLTGSWTYTVGAGGTGGTSAAGSTGGTSTFTNGTTTVSATGGAGGARGADRTGDTVEGFNGSGGVGSGGDINLYGGPSAVALRVSFPISGTGGYSVMGVPGAGIRGSSNGQYPGNAGKAYGGGGGGALTRESSTSAKGGDGAAGVVIITEFYGA